MSQGGYTEDHLVEQPAIVLLMDDLGWEYANCYDEWASGVAQIEEAGLGESRTPPEA